MNGFKWFMQQEKPQPRYLSLTAPQTGGGGGEGGASKGNLW